MAEDRLRILHLEDDAHDRELVAAVLSADGVQADVVTVATRDAFQAALAAGGFDVILADDRLPAFDGGSAQKMAAERLPQVPLIFVSGTLGEEVAVERLKAGAVDYVLKQRLGRLPGALRRAIAESRIRVEHARAEAEVRRLNAELEQRVLDRTAELAKANTALAEREQALRTSEQRLQSILDHSPAAICLKDMTGRYLFVNRRFEGLVGLEREAVMGRTDRDLFPPRLAEIYRENDERAVAGGALVEMEEPVLRDGLVRVLASARFPLVSAEGTTYAVCGISTDVTERKHWEDELKAARLEAERANRAKSEFLSRMSHDLRTPLNAVLGFAQLLNVERLSAPQVECVEQILKGGRHLLQLINEVLDIARIEAGRLSLSPEAVSVRDTVGHAAALIAPLAAQRHISVTIRESPLLDRAVRADRQRLSQVLLNLLSNAVKYNHDRGTVVLSFEEQAGRRLRINVTDTGPGIPRAKLRLLFTPFERLGAESTLVEGTGLGLTLARGLAEAMGGDVGVSSVVDQGSTFWVELDETDEPVPVGLSEHFAPISTEACRAATVLYIEDNLSNARLMERVLARRPAIRLVHAADGTHGLEAARSAHPDLILLDMHLPDMPGEEVLRLLFTDPLLRAIPTVVLSADAMPEQVKRVTAAGAAAYLTKPLNVGEVLSVLDRLLAQRDETEESAGE